MDKLLTIEDLAEMLGVSEATIYGWTSQGKIPHIKLGKRLVRFREAEIITWLDSQKSKEPAAPVSFIGKQRGRKGSRSDIDRLIENVKREVLG